MASSENDDGSQSGSTATATKLDDLTRILGFFSNEYPCVHNNFQGILYSGPQAAVFVGKILFFEWTVVLRWENVIYVQKQENSVTIEVRSPKPARYDFAQFGVHLDKAWSSLVSLHNDSILDTRNRSSLISNHHSITLRRTTSDPASLRSSIFDDPQLSSLEAQEEDFHHAGECGSTVLRKGVGRAVSTPIEKNGSNESKPESRVALESKGAAASLVTTSTTTTTRKQHYSEMVDETKETYAHRPIEGLQLSCTLDLFIDLFLSDTAQHSIQNFMREKGDEDFQSSNWVESNMDGSSSRLIEYTHPVNAPMAPPMARARKEQTYQKIGSRGLVLETKTFVSDVPMTDCFFVSDRLLVSANDGDAETVSISMYFDIRFVKSNMFRSIISRTTKGEFDKFMHGLSEFMKEKLGEGKHAVASTQLTTTKQVPQPIQLSMHPVATTALIIASVLFQVWTMVEMRSLKAEVRALQESILQQCLRQ